jgi:bifunctional pyridoxal-dependent enzyme with beta-cystathionase and maltose regulon repressor activities
VKDQTLTDQELEASYLAKFDLGPGYPQLPVPDYVKRLYLDDTIEEISLKFPPNWSPEKQTQVDADLTISVKQFIDIPTSNDYCVFSTFSGSIALDRSIAAVQEIANRWKKRRIRVITTTPCIDIMRLFLSERSNVSTTYVRSNYAKRFGAINVDGIIEAILRTKEKKVAETVCVLISSPENPTGEVWSETDFRRLAKACSDTGSILLVDHCFCVAGIHDPANVCRIWDIAPDGLDWIAVWDTGKTFGLNEDKLGFIICRSEATTTSVQKALAVLQFGVPRRAKLFYADLFRKASYFHHIEKLREDCICNLQTLKSRENDKFVVRQMNAGSLSLVDIYGTGKSDEDVRSHLISKGVGVISGNVFFHDRWVENRYIRIALARRPDYFEQAVDTLMEHLP